MLAGVPLAAMPLAAGAQDSTLALLFDAETDVLMAFSRTQPAGTMAFAEVVEMQAEIEPFELEATVETLEIEAT